MYVWKYMFVNRVQNIAGSSQHRGQAMPRRLSITGTPSRQNNVQGGRQKGQLKDSYTCFYQSKAQVLLTRQKPSSRVDFGHIKIHAIFVKCYEA